MLAEDSQFNFNRDREWIVTDWKNYDGNKGTECYYE